MLLLLAIHAGSSPASSSSSPSSPSPLPFFSFASLAELWWWRSSSVPSILLLTLLVVLLTSLTLHLLSPSSDPSPSSLLHKYRYRHDGYLSYAPSRCTLPPSATLSTFRPSPPSTRTLRTLHLHPLPRPGNALPSPPRPRAVLLWLPPLHSHALHSAGLLQHVAYVGDAVVAIDWWGMGKDRVGGMGGGRAEAWEWEGVVEEVGECAAEVQRGYAGVPLFIGGESFGASIAMAAALKRPHLYTGMVLLAPAIKLTVHPLKLLTIKATALVAPRARIQPPWAMDQLSRNLRSVERQRTAATRLHHMRHPAPALP